MSFKVFCKIMTEHSISIPKVSWLYNIMQVFNEMILKIFKEKDFTNR